MIRISELLWILSSQVIDIDKAQISPVPTESHQELINGMISLNEHSVLLFLDQEQLTEPVF